MIILPQFADDRHKLSTSLVVIRVWVHGTVLAAATSRRAMPSAGRVAQIGIHQCAVHLVTGRRRSGMIHLVRGLMRGVQLWR